MVKKQTTVRFDEHTLRELDAIIKKVPHVRNRSEAIRYAVNLVYKHLYGLNRQVNRE